MGRWPPTRSSGSTWTTGTGERVGRGSGSVQDHDTDHWGRALGLEGYIRSPPHLSARPRAGNHGQRHPRREDRQVPLPLRVPPAGETKRCSCTGRGSSEGAPQCSPRAVPRLGQRQAGGGHAAAESSRHSRDWPWDSLWRESIPGRASATGKGPAGGGSRSQGGPNGAGV